MQLINKLVRSKTINQWIKKDGTLFDVTMGSNDGAEVCDLVGLYLLAGLKRKFENLDLGLYRDDGLGIYNDHPGPEAERTKKKIYSISVQMDYKSPSTST